jgi:hypothetical protein
MKIETKKYGQLLNTSRVLLIVSIILYSFTVLLFFFTIILQKSLVPFVIGYGINNQFIFPVVYVVRFVICFVVFLFFALMIINKKVKSNTSIVLEISALVSIILLNTVFNSVMNIFAIKSDPRGNLDYAVWNNGLTYLLSYAVYLLPFALMLFYVGTTIKMVICVLDPIRIADDIES